MVNGTRTHFGRMVTALLGGVLLALLAGCGEHVPEALQADPPAPAANTRPKEDGAPVAVGVQAPVNRRFDSLLDDIVARGELRVGVSPGFIPFVAGGKDAQMVRSLVSSPLPDEPRDVVGFDIELARALAASLEVKLVVVQRDGIAAVLSGLQAGEIDIAISGLSRTLKRARDFFFSEPYYTSGIVVLVPRQSPYNKLADLNLQNVRLLVKPGSTAQTFATRNLPNAQVIAAKDEATLATLLDQGDRVAILDEIKARNFSLAKMLKGDFRQLEGRRYTDEHFSIALPRDEALRSYVNIFLQDFQESGELDALTRTFSPWLGAAR